MRPIDADALRQVREVFTEKDTLGHTPLQLCDAMPTASPWHRLEDGLPKDGQCCLFFTIESGIPERDAWFGIYRNYWEVDINMRFDYWMPIEPPKEDA